MQTKLTSEKIRIKCVFGEDISIIRVMPKIRIDELRKRLKKEYGATMVLKYKDSQGILPSAPPALDINSV